MRISKFTQISAARWPWQDSGAFEAFLPDRRKKFGWRNFGSVGRFGGGWRFKFGIEIGNHSIDFNLGFGAISIYRDGGWPWHHD